MKFFSFYNLILGPNNSKNRLKILHRNGPCSHLGGGKTKPLPLAAIEILSEDQSRVDFLQSRLSNNSRGSAVRNSEARVPARSGRYLGSGNYVVRVGLGSPRTDLSLIFDTGSDLTWIQCKPCTRYCHKQQDPIFDPTKSSSYSNVTCSADECSQLSSATSSPTGCSASTCIYSIQYGDGSYSVGYFGREMLRLTASSSDIFPNFLFGCGQNNQGLFGNAAGLLGLGRHRLSLVSQTANSYGQVFSYCLPSTSSSTGYLAFGREAISSVSSAIQFTSLLTNSQYPSFYFLELTAISVGGRRLPVSASDFANSGTIIDSGTVITRLPPSVYSALRSAFRQLMSKYRSAEALSILDTCYDLTRYRTIRIPKIGLHFRGDIVLDVHPNGILYSGNVSQVCLAFAGNDDNGDVTILGNKQQQNLKVIYDLAKQRIGFGPGDCN
uniref:Peptidase A1 domain-containing protein n=1 Tax=Nelumbo nucifera TaxID=4432 RepID=A0A822ZF58_NELNU|nr:TPA_asm: hypothetical protein HUJ06_001747 [Nelumbo nucifera]